MADEEAERAEAREKQANRVLAMLPGPLDPASGRWRMIMKGLKSMPPEALDDLEAVLMVCAAKISPEGVQPSPEGMTDEVYEAYWECKQAFDAKVLALVPAYLQARSPHDRADATYLDTVTVVGDTHVWVEGEEVSWRSCGRCHHEVRIPRKFLTDPEYRAAMRRGEVKE